MMAEPVSTTSSTIGGMQIVSAGLIVGTVAMTAVFIYLRMGPMPDSTAAKYHSFVARHGSQLPES